MEGTGRHLLVVVDMQNDFITGALGTHEAEEILPRVVEAVRAFKGPVLFTRDTHDKGYPNTQEGRLLPVAHCVAGTQGWQIHQDLEALRRSPAIDKPAFGSLELGEALRRMNAEAPLDSITFMGLCTDICVISNALIAKAALPETEVRVDASRCAGVTPESHHTALSAMKACQIQVINEETP